MDAGNRGQEDPLFTQLYAKEISLLGIAIVLAQYRFKILTAACSAALLGLLIALVLPNRYTASTSLLPPQQSSSSTGAAIMAQLGSLGALAGSGASGALKNPSDLQVALLKSRTVEDAVISRYGLDKVYKSKRPSEARKELEKRVDIESGLKDGIIKISVTDHDPKQAAEIANGYVEEFQKFSANLAVTEASQRRLFFERQLVEAKDSLANAEEDLKKTEQATGVIQVDSQLRTAIESVAQLRAQIAAKEVQIRGLRSFATEQNPDVQKAQEELAQLQAEQRKLGATSEGSSNGLLIPKGSMQQAALDYVRKLREVRYRQTVFDLLARQYEAAKVDEARQGAMVQIIDKAVEPDQKSSPKVLLLAAGAGFLGLLLSIGYAFSVEGYKKLAQNPYEKWRLERLKGLFAGSRSAS